MVASYYLHSVVSDTSPPLQAVPGDQPSIVVVPIGEMDHFAAQRLVEVASARIEGGGDIERVVIDLSVLTFCDSSVGRIVEWASDVGDELDVTVVLGDAVEHVVALLPDPDGLLRGVDVR